MRLIFKGRKEAKDTFNSITNIRIINESEKRIFTVNDDAPDRGYTDSPSQSRLIEPKRIMHLDSNSEDQSSGDGSKG